MRQITKKAKEEMVRHLIATNTHFLLRAITIVYKNQTPKEKWEQKTIATNNLGFQPRDAPMLSRFACQILEKRGLSWDEIAKAQRRMRKYTGQVAASAERKRDFFNPKMEILFFQAHLRGAILDSTPKAVKIQANRNIFWVPRSIIFSQYQITGTGEEVPPQDFLVNPYFIDREIAKVCFGRIVGATERALYVQLVVTHIEDDYDYEGTLKSSKEWSIPKSILMAEYDPEFKELQRFLLPRWFIEGQQDLPLASQSHAKVS